MNDRNLPFILLALAGLIVVGSLGPWVTAGFVSANGTDGDGMLTLLLGAAAAVVAGLSLNRAARARYIGIGIAAAISAAVGVYDWADIANEPAGPLGLTARPGWGLILMTLASMASVAIAVVGWRQSPGPAPAMGQATPTDAATVETGRRDPFKRL